MTHITITPDAATEARVRQIADETGRRFEDLAECALAEEALRYFRHRNDDPGRDSSRRPTITADAGARHYDRDGYCDNPARGY